MSCDLVSIINRSQLPATQSIKVTDDFKRGYRVAFNAIKEKEKSLKEILQSGQNPENRLQPTIRQCMDVIKLIESQGIRRFSKNSDWMSFIDAQGGEEQLFSACHDVHSKMIDQKKRADAIVKNLNGSKSILMMDGHGRMYYSILKSLVYHGFDVDEFHFTFVDIDPMVNNWHLIFFPEKSCTSLEKCIFKHIKEMSSKTIICTFVYFNFCGLYDMHESIKITLKKICLFGKHHMISMSERGTVCGGNTSKFLHYLSSSYKRTSISKNKTFFSYLISYKDLQRNTIRRSTSSNAAKSRHNSTSVSRRLTERQLLKMVIAKSLVVQ